MRFSSDRHRRAVMAKMNSFSDKSYNRLRGFLADVDKGTSSLKLSRVLDSLDGQMVVYDFLLDSNLNSLGISKDYINDNSLTQKEHKELSAYNRELRKSLVGDK